MTTSQGFFRQKRPPAQSAVWAQVGGIAAPVVEPELLPVPVSLSVPVPVSVSPSVVDAEVELEPEDDAVAVAVAVALAEPAVVPVVPEPSSPQPSESAITTGSESRRSICILRRYQRILVVVTGAETDRRGALSLDEAMAFLQQVEAGELTLTPNRQPQAAFVGHVTYAASNGWTVVIFNDANEWDYVHDIETADGRTLSRADATTLLDRYDISDEIAWTRYRLPGCCRLRCEACGRDIDRRPHGEPWTYTCRGCGGVHELKDPATG